jgi:hypothetical protein
VRSKAYLDGVFILAREGIHGPLLQALLALRQPLVPGKKNKMLIRVLHIDRHENIDCLTFQQP